MSTRVGDASGNIPSSSKDNPDHRKLWISILRRPMRLISLVARRQPKVNRNVMAMEP
ncbi:hypothetical protein D3C81_2205460 [compost metagenome]